MGRGGAQVTGGLLLALGFLHALGVRNGGGSHELTCVAVAAAPSSTLIVVKSVAVFPGAASWTVVKTAPLELLGERSRGAERMRLAEACAALGASAIQVNVSDGTGIVLAEVSPEGEGSVSGLNHQGPDILAWHAGRIAEELLFPQLLFHPLRDLLGDGFDAERIARRFAARLGGANAAFCDNLVSVDTLVTHKPLEASGGVLSYFRWQGPSRFRSAGAARGPAR